MTKAPENTHSLLEQHFPGQNVTAFQLSRTCHASLYHDKIPNLSTTNGYFYPPNLLIAHH